MQQVCGEDGASLAAGSVRGQVGLHQRLHCVPEHGGLHQHHRHHPGQFVGDSEWSEKGVDMFLEIFVGQGELTRMVEKQGLCVVRTDDIFKGDFDLMSNTRFAKLIKMIRNRQVWWLHAAPPCRTFSMARRRDRFGTVSQLRSAEKLTGIIDTAEVREANDLAFRAVRLARAQYRAGGWFTIENPEAITEVAWC